MISITFLQFQNQPYLQMIQTCSYLIKISKKLVPDVNVELQKISIWLKENKLSLNLTKMKSTLFHSQKKKRLIANDLPIL